MLQHSYAFCSFEGMIFFGRMQCAQVDADYYHCTKVYQRPKNNQHTATTQRKHNTIAEKSTHVYKQRKDEIKIHHKFYLLLRIDAFQRIDKNDSIIRMLIFFFNLYILGALFACCLGECAKFKGERQLLLICVAITKKILSRQK